MIIDATNPAQPVELFHIPVPVAGGQAQMARMCLGSDLPKGVQGHVYLLRNIQGNTAQRSGYEIWDVTDTTNPSPVGTGRPPVRRRQTRTSRRRARCRRKVVDAAVRV